MSLGPRSLLCNIGMGTLSLGDYFGDEKCPIQGLVQDQCHSVQ